MLKPALAAALIVGAISTAAFARDGRPVQYYFGTANGGDYCDGLLLTQKGNVFTGIHNSLGNICQEGDYAGGFYADGFGPGAMDGCETVTPQDFLATIATEDQPNGGTNFELLYNIDINNRFFSVWVIADGGIPVSCGKLFIGPGASRHPPLNRPAWRPR